MTSKPTQSVHAIVAAVEKETPKRLRIERILLLGEDGKPLKFIGGAMRWRVDTEDEMRTKFILAMIACQGDASLMRRLSPDRISLMAPREFDEPLPTSNAGVATSSW